MHRLAPLALLAFLACPGPRPTADGGPPPAVCELDLDGSGHFSRVGTGARAVAVDGGVVLQNGVIRVMVSDRDGIEGPLRTRGAVVEAGTAQGPNRALRAMVFAFGFGRTSSAEEVEILRDGTSGGYAAVVVRGRDVVMDRIHLSHVATDRLGLPPLVVDVDTPLDLEVATALVLSPGEDRVRLFSALCNRGKDEVVTVVGDVLAVDGELINPGSCAGGTPGSACALDATTGFTLWGSGVAFGYRAYQPAAPRQVASSALLSAGSVHAVIAGARGGAEVLAWTDPAAIDRPGALGIIPGQQRTFLRDLFIGSDPALVSTAQLAVDGAARSRLTVSVDAGVDRGGVTLLVREASSQRVVTLTPVPDGGIVQLDLPPGQYSVAAGGADRAPTFPRTVSVPAGGSTDISLALAPRRRLVVTSVDPSGGPVPARVVVRCPLGPCSAGRAVQRPFGPVEPLPDDIQAVGFTDENGSSDTPIPAGEYEVMVSRGPGWSAWPQEAPVRGVSVDLRTSDATLTAVLAPVVDRTDWVSVDPHTHTRASLGSPASMTQRVAAGVASGLDAVLITDRDRGGPHVEVSPFSYGHLGVLGGAGVDWAGGDGPSLDPQSLSSAIRSASPGAVVIVNHPRRALIGAFRQLGVNPAAGTFTAPPSRFRFPGDAGTSYPFPDGLEVLTGAEVDLTVINDWMTLLSRGTVLVPVGGSDAHGVTSETTGSAFTWVRGSTAELPGSLRGGRVVASTGPLVQVTARVDGGMEAGPGELLAAPPGSAVEVRVEVQAPVWMTFDRIELHTHAEDRGADGGADPSWPEARAAAVLPLDPTALPIELVDGGSRIHVRTSFPFAPSRDTWLAVVVRSTAAVRPVAPLSWSAVRCDGGHCTASQDRPFAVTGAILIDRDGDGAYRP